MFDVSRYINVIIYLFRIILFLRSESIELVQKFNERPFKITKYKLLVNWIILRVIPTSSEFLLNNFKFNHKIHQFGGRIFLNIHRRRSPLCGILICWTLQKIIFDQFIEFRITTSKWFIESLWIRRMDGFSIEYRNDISITFIHATITKFTRIENLQPNLIGYVLFLIKNSFNEKIITNNFV